MSLVRVRCANAAKMAQRAFGPRATDFYTDPTRASESTVTSTPEINASQRKILDSALRIDQAGEIAANAIYKGQMTVLSGDPQVGHLIQEMWDQEKRHLVVMNKLQVQHRIRPTVLTEVAKAAGFALGAATALMGKEAAMACTEAVETAIGEHYEDQVKEFESLPGSHQSIILLKDVVRELRDDELEHLDIAVEHHSQRAPAHALLSTIINGGCQVAIELCRRY